MALKKYRCL